MKKLYLLFILFTAFANAQDAFITTWEVNNDDLTIHAPIYGIDNNYNIDFGDGTILTNQTQSVTHTYSNPGIYTINISGDFNQLEVFSDSNDNFKLLTVEQWGSTQWATMEEAFINCYNLTLNATDTPDLSLVSNMSSMFEYCSLINSPIDNWNVSNVTNMSRLFYGAQQFNQPLNNWNVSNVTDMEAMFANTPYNQPLDNWDVSNVTNMKEMFYSAIFVQSINNWDVSSVTNMERMFADTFHNQPLNDWDVSNVTNMKEMFLNCWMFNQPLNNWDVSNVMDMEAMFNGCSDFDQPLGNWNVSNVNNLKAMFTSAQSFNQPLNSWNVSNVTNMEDLFFGAFNFNQPLDNWDVSNVTNMHRMLAWCGFNQPINNWDVSNVTIMSAMFALSDFNQPLDNWDVSSVTTMEEMFGGSESFNQPIDSWNVSNVVNMNGMFKDASDFNQPINSWNVSNVTEMNHTFSQTQVFNQPLDDWDVSNVTTMIRMFNNAETFNKPLTGWDVSNVIQMSSMFENATLFNQDLSSWNFNSNVNLSRFINECALSINNYENLLLKFIQLEIGNRILGADGIQYCNEGIRNYLIQEFNWTINGDIQGEECQGNNISGNVIYDENANGCDMAEDDLIGSFLVNANDGQFNYSTVSSDGEYNLNVMEGTYTVEVLNVPDYYTVTPATDTAEFTGFGNDEQLNFCFTANETVNDLNITLLAINEARPGFESQYKLVVQNIGTLTLTGITASLTYDETIQSFVSASQIPASTSANQLNFDIASISPLESMSIYITMETFTPPTINGGETIAFSATLTLDTGDNTPDDNTYSLEQLVVNSYDPNDKRVMQGEEIYIEDAGKYLDYVIRFQNTGSASALTVRIEDELHPNLDWSTFMPITASHDYRVEITDGSHVEFIFDNINLPHEAADEEGSNGFVAYKIKPVPDIEVGDTVTGTASIFFDYNLPIITNSADTEVVEFLSVNEYAINAVSVYPNPSEDIVYLHPLNNIAIEGVTIYNLQGIKVITLKGHQQHVNVQNLSIGVYLLHIKTDNGISRHRLIKK